MNAICDCGNTTFSLRAQSSSMATLCWLSALGGRRVQSVEFKTHCKKSCNAHCCNTQTFCYHQQHCILHSAISTCKSGVDSAGHAIETGQRAGLLGSLATLAACWTIQMSVAGP